ncbi:MAG: 50S ribosomal protein L33 [Deltaproteobacteria bacterium]|nr:MAG: 50S ribosomal protein L33 [Deltaproteobacteria bacterium]
MAKKNVRELIKLESSAKTGFFYVSQKNKANTKEKLSLKKYDPRIKSHILFKEIKLK